MPTYGNTITVEVLDADTFTGFETVGVLRILFSSVDKVPVGCPPGKPKWRHVRRSQPPHTAAPGCVPCLTRARGERQLYGPLHRSHQQASAGGVYNGSLLIGLSTLRNDAVHLHLPNMPHVRDV